MKVRQTFNGQRKNLSQLSPGDFFFFDGKFYIAQTVRCAICVADGIQTLFPSDYSVTTFPQARIVIETDLNEEGCEV